MEVYTRFLCGVVVRVYCSEYSVVHGYIPDYMHPTKDRDIPEVHLNTQMAK